MRRAVVAPLASLFMPGLGQIVNRQPVKGGLMVAAVSVLFLATLGYGFYQFSQAVMALDDLPPQADKWALLNMQLVAQGIIWLLVMLGLYLAVLIWSVVDAFRAGRDLDRQERGEG